jgi:hypothetical protein
MAPELLRKVIASLGMARRYLYYAQRVARQRTLPHARRQGRHASQIQRKRNGAQALLAVVHAARPSESFATASPP